MLKLVWSLILISGLAALPAPAGADEIFPIGANITVEVLTAMPAGAGGRSELRFRIVNESGSDLVLLGISTPVAERARLVARLGPDCVTVMRSISVRAGETLDLTTSHLRYEISPLSRSLNDGEEIPVTFELNEARVSVTAHVHGGDLGGTEAGNLATNDAL